MPAYSTMQDFVAALNSGKTRTTLLLDDFFDDPARVRDHDHWTDLRDGDWSAGPPGWLASVLDADPPWGIGLIPPERNHVLAWPAPELEKARAAAVRAVRGSGHAQARAPKFFWELYKGPAPRTLERFNSDGDPEIVFQSPRRAVVMEDDEVFVRDVPLEPES